MDLSLRDLEQAISMRREIDRLQMRLRQLLGKIGGDNARQGARRKLSRQARAKIAAAARARWAKQRAGKRMKGSGKRRSGITPAGRRRLSQLMKARWAARRRHGKRR